MTPLINPLEIRSFQRGQSIIFSIFKNYLVKKKKQLLALYRNLKNIYIIV